MGDTGTVKCPQCGRDSDAAQRFCGACGNPLARTCPSCGAGNPPGFRFCGTCGASLEEPAGPRAPTGEERRWATVVFADLSGFTSLSERTDPEDVRALVDRCMAKLGPIVERFGGTVERVMGDAILAVFGAPVSHEDDPERAVRAALEMVTCAQENREEFGGLPLRIGVNTGEMMFAPVGPEGARHYTMMGDAVNVGARLQAAAPRDGVFVGEETWRATRRAIAYEEIGPIEAKGKEAPVPAWRAVGTLAPPAERMVSTVPMIGRDREMDLLGTIWERVQSERRPHLVTVLAPPGMGKTRLTREFVRVAEGHGAQILTGRSLPYGESGGYGAFAQQVKGAARILETDPLPEARRKLRGLLDDARLEDAEILGEQIALLVGLGAGSGVADRQALFFAARRLFEALASTRPTVAVFEDIHWADASLLDLTESLAGRVRDVPLLLLALARPELLDSRPAWGGGLVGYTALPLEPLTAADAVALAVHLMPNFAEASGLAVRFAKTAAGNPLFIEELAASTLERAAGEAADLPTNVKTIIAARIDALPATERRVLLEASAVGQVFWRGALERLGAGDGLPEALDRLERRDLIRREPVSRLHGDVEFSFKHGLTRDVAYSTLSHAARRVHHATVARFLEEATGERMDESATLLARHWREAGDRERAARYFVTAAEGAARAWAKAEAVALYAEAIALLPDGAEVRRRSLRFRRALTMSEAGDLPAAAKELESLLPELEGRDLLDATLARGRAAYWMGDVETGEHFAAEAERLVATVDAPEFAARVRAFSGDMASMRGRVAEGLEITEAAIAAWPAGFRLGEFAALVSQAALSHYWLGNAAAAVERGREAYTLGMQHHHVEAALTAGSHVGMALVALGRHEEAFAVFERVVTQGRDVELVPRFTSRAMNAWAGGLRELFDLDGARRLNEEAAEMAARAQFLNGRVQAGADLVFADLAAGEYGRAEAALPVLIEQAAGLKGWHEWLVGGRLAQARAETLLGAGRPEEAADAAAASIERARAVGRRKYETAARTVLGAALLALGRPDEAIAEHRAALEAAERLAHPPSVWRAAAELGRALAVAGRDDEAAAAFRRAHEAISSFAEGLGEEHRGRLLASPPVAGIITTGR